ncbi:hypothetical protein VTN77DRAFT_6215 [Rasamsonia byssochlamydoides]|uniref:uncharacterized protein n=1 Tax=Rasamsonia byssochlamydoides TaxID=89139 RepID=UPI0037449CEE
MLALRSAQDKSADDNKSSMSSAFCTPNILPCRVHHDGPVEVSKRYWNPVKDDNGNAQTAYFRGRKLRGRRVALPEGYEGVVAVPTDRILPSSNPDVKPDGATNGDAEEPVKILEKQATFNEFVVWGHEVLPAADDPFVKGVEEWLKFAEAMHSSAPPSAGNGEPNSSTQP